MSLMLTDIGACRVDAGKVELDGAQYLGFHIPLTISQLVWIEAILVGGAEIYRNRERNPETRLYPGKPPNPPSSLTACCLQTSSCTLAVTPGTVKTLFMDHRDHTVACALRLECGLVVLYFHTAC